MIMTSFKTSLAVSTLVLCFGIGSALAQTTPGNPTPPANPANPSTTTPVPNGATGNKNGNDPNPSASVVAECAAKAEQQGLVGDAKGAFLTECENIPMKK
jgi:hypothetical protein